MNCCPQFFLNNQFWQACDDRVPSIVE